MTGDDDSTTRARSFGARLLRNPEVMISLSLLVIVLVFVALAPSAFLSGINLRNMAVEASVMLILSVGMTYVIITAGIDLSVGAVLVFSSVVATQAMRAVGSETAIAPLVGLAAALLSAGIWGWINGMLIARIKLSPLIVTLATMGVALGGARLLSGGVDLTGVPSVIVDTIGVGRLFGIPVVVLFAVAAVAIGGIALHYTRFGLYTFAIGSSDQAARRSGVQVERHLIRVYIISGLCAGFAGYLSLARFASTTISGHSTDNLKAITAVVLGGASLFGGAGTMGGTIVGVFIPVVLASGLVIVGLPSFWQEVAVGIVLLLAVTLDQWRRKTRA